MGIQLWGNPAESHPITLPSLNGGEGCPFSVPVPPSDTVNSESVVGMTPGDSSVVIGYQVNEFTPTWLQSALLLDYIFILVLWVRFHH